MVAFICFAAGFVTGVVIVGILLAILFLTPMGPSF